MFPFHSNVINQTQNQTDVSRVVGVVIADIRHKVAEDTPGCELDCAVIRRHRQQIGTIPTETLKKSLRNRARR